MREKSIVSSIVKLLNAIAGVKAIKMHGSPFARKGTPDIHATVRNPQGVGVSVWMECKRPGEQPTTIQQIELDRWKEAGAITAVVTSKQQAIDIVRSILLA